MSSDYLLGQLGYDLTEAARRLGDGRYETRMIADAVRAQTGQRFLADGLASDYEQFQYLMDNALASKQALNLSVGVGLTSEQVAALTHDIVWMEERVIDGETVLTPVLYLAKVDARNLRGGSLVQGRDVQMISGGDLKNVGTIRASEDLTAISGGSIFQGGLAQANNTLTLLAQDSIRNAMSGQIRASTVNLTSLTGDIINDRTAVQFQLGAGSTTQLDAGGSIHAGSQLAINAANDLTSLGQISSDGDASLSAGNDLNLLAVEDRTVSREALRRGMRTEETVTQLGASVSAAGNLSLSAGNDLNAVASTASAGKNLTVSAERDINLLSAADEHNVESTYKKGKKKVEEIDEQTRQVATEFSAGENLDIDAGRDVTLLASRLKAGEEAYVYAGQNLALLAAQNRDYMLYDMQKKGSFGSKASQRDEVTDVRHVGSEISTGSNLTLQSGGDQLYQVAKLESGKDLTLDSGGAITFEGVKDLHQESHEKSKSDLAWTSMSGKGSTDETLRQSQLIAQGELTIKAVKGLNIDIRQIDQQTVSQTIDAMVQADPQLAWLKEAEKRGDVDWRQVKELHDAYKYSHSSLGQGAMLAIIIIVTVLTAGAASGAVGTLAGTGAGSGSFMAAAGSTAMVQAGTAVGTAAAGLGNVMASAALTSMASTAAVSVVNNKGNLGATLKEVTSSDSLKGYLTSAAMAGFMPNYSPTALGLDLASAQAVLMKTTGEAFINTVINGGSYSDNLAQALVSQGNNIVIANGFKLVGDWALGKYGEGSIQKVMAHAVMGGLLAEATGSDFKTGAIAAGANEALVNVLDSWVHGDQNLHGMASQLTGLLAAAAVNGDLNKGVEIAKYATTYNRQLHAEEQKWLEENAKTFAKDRGISEQTAMERLSQQALKDTDLFWRIFLGDGTDVDAQKFLAASGRTFTNDLGEQQALFTATGAQFIRMEMFADTVDPAFYKKFVSSGINRQLGEGLLTELKDLGIEVKDGTAALYEAVKQNPTGVAGAVFEAVMDLPEGVIDSFQESGHAIGEGAAVALNPEITAKLSALYGQDVETLQKAMLALQVMTAVMGAKSVAAFGDMLSGKLVAKVGKDVHDGAGGNPFPATIEYQPSGAMIMQGDGPFCGPACAAMLISDGKGHEVSLSDAISRFSEVRATGVGTDDLSDVLSKSGIANKMETRMYADSLDQALAYGKSVIVQVKAGARERHFFIVDSLVEDNGGFYYMTRDSAAGPRGVSADILRRAMSDGVNAIVVGD